MHFDDAGTLVVENVRSGFVDARWFSILSMGIFKLADGASVPPAMIQRLKLDEWKAAHALKLRPGDWLVLNNRAVQHGRLPFADAPAQKRTIGAVYTE